MFSLITSKNQFEQQILDLNFFIRCQKQYYFLNLKQTWFTSVIPNNSLRKNHFGKIFQNYCLILFISISKIEISMFQRNSFRLFFPIHTINQKKISKFDYISFLYFNFNKNTRIKYILEISIIDSFWWLEPFDNSSSI